jgi:SAM-dependent methyltransferase
VIRLLRRLPARLLLRALLRLDNWLYRAITDAAIRYGRGVHPKHRLIGYHDFFIDRIGPGERVLDIGCGNGAVDLDIVKATGARVIGIDHSRASVEYARRRHGHERLTFVEADARTFVPDGPIDTVILSNILEHLDGRVEFLRDLVDRLAPRRLLIRVPMYDREWLVPLKDELGVDYLLDPTHRVEYTQEALLKELADAGLRVEDLTVRWGELWVSARRSG